MLRKQFSFGYPDRDRGMAALFYLLLDHIVSLTMSCQHDPPFLYKFVGVGRAVDSLAQPSVDAGTLNPLSYPGYRTNIHWRPLCCINIRSSASHDVHLSYVSCLIHRIEACTSFFLSLKYSSVAR